MNRTGAVRALPACAAFAALAALTPTIAAPQARGSVLRGRVLSAAGQPLPGAMVILRGGDTARTDSAGHYRVERIPQGRSILLVRHAGYDPIEMELNLPSDTLLDVDVPLEPARAASAAAVNERLRAVGFTQRQRAAEGRRTSVRYLGPAEVAALGAVRAAQLFDGLPEIQVRSQGAFALVYADGGRCVATLWIDGVLETSMSATRGIDQILNPAAVLAMEIYPRSSQVPPEFLPAGPQLATPGRRQLGITGRQASRQYETRTSECGAVVIWTQSGGTP